MKFLKGFITFILGLLAFALIFALSLVIRTKSFVEKEVLTAVVKESTKEAVKNSDMSEEQQDLIDKVLNDKDAIKIINRIEQNYLDYQNDSNYVLSKDDYNLVLDFILKYNNELNKLYKTNHTDAEIRDLIKYEDMQKFAKNTFRDLTTNSDTRDANEALSIYVRVTSMQTTILAILAILFLMALVAIVNWSLVKCLKVLGIDFIISGILLVVVYAVLEVVFTNMITDQEVTNIINSISLNGFAIIGVCELILGIISVIVYKKLNKKKSSKKEETKIEEPKEEKPKKNKKD